LKEGNLIPRATGRAGPIPHPAYCTPQCYAKGKRVLSASCKCRGCRGDAHGRGRKYAFDHGYLKYSLPGSRKPPLDQELLFPDGEISPEQAMRQSKEVQWISVPLREGVEPDETVWISVAKLDASWRKNRAQYIGPGGSTPTSMRHSPHRPTHRRLNDGSSEIGSATISSIPRERRRSEIHRPLPLSRLLVAHGRSTTSNKSRDHTKVDSRSLARSLGMQTPCSTFVAI
jgi:hypothetical protein